MKKLVLAALFLMYAGESRPEPMTEQHRNTYAYSAAAIAAALTTVIAYLSFPEPTGVDMLKSGLELREKGIPFDSKHYMLLHRTKKIVLSLLCGGVAGVGTGALVYLLANSYIPKNNFQSIKNKVKKIRHGRIMSHADNIFQRNNRVDQNGILSIADINYNSDQKVKELYEDLSKTREQLRDLNLKLDDEGYRTLEGRDALKTEINTLEHKLQSITQFIRDKNLHKYNFKNRGTQRIYPSPIKSIPDVDVDVNFFDIFGVNIKAEKT